MGGAVAALAVVTLGASPAWAAGTWLNPMTLASTPDTAYAPAAGVDATGSVTVAYGAGDSLWVDEHSAAGPWAAPVAVAGVQQYPVLAEDAAGDTVLAYSDGSQIQAAVQPAGEPWSSPATFTDLGAGTTAQTQFSPTVDVAIDDRGDAVAVWLLSGTTNQYTSVEAAYRPAGGAWQAPVTLATQAWSNVAPSVRFSAGGEAIATWAAYLDINRQAIDVATLDVGSGTWSAATLIPGMTSNGFAGVSLAAGDAGEATVVADGYVATAHQDELVAAQRSTDGDWTTDDLGTEGADGVPAVAMNEAGDAAVVWDDASALVASVDSAPGTWSAPQTLSTATNVQNPEIAVGTDGTVTADWVENDTSSRSLLASTLAPGGAWTTPVTRATSGSIFGGATVVDPGGDVDALRAGLQNGNDTVFSVAEDGAGPVLEDLSIPATGTVGVPVTFSVSPLDAWSGVATTTWSFGDGQSMPDQIVSHTYTAPGTYPVTVQSSDVLGNPTIQTGTITISPAPGSAGGGTSVTPTPTVRTAVTPLILTQVSERHPRWREPTRARVITPAERRIPLGTRFGFTVNQAATLTFTFARHQPGRLVHGVCREPADHRAHRPRCLRWVTSGQLTVHATTAGHHTVRFAGRIRKRELHAGRYAVTIRATATVSGAGTVSRRLRFTIA